MVWAGALVNPHHEKGKCVESSKKFSLKPNAASHTTTSWCPDTDGFLEHSPSRGSLYFKGSALQKLIPVLGSPPSYIHSILSIFKWHIVHSVTLSTFIMLYNHHHHLATELCSSGKTEILFPLNSNPPSPPPSTPSNNPLLSLSLTTVGTSCKWNHILCFCDWLISLGINVLKIHPCCSMCQNFLPGREKCFASSHNQKKDSDQSKNNKQPEVPENQTAWNSDNQGVKRKFTKMDRRLAAEQKGPTARQQTTRARWGWLNGELKTQR